MDILLKHIQQALEIPQSTLTLIAVMAAVAMYFLRNHLVVPGMIVFIYPLVVALSVGVNYGLVSLNYFVLNHYDEWMVCTICSATIGVVGGMLIAAGLARFAEHLRSNRDIRHLDHA